MKDVKSLINKLEERRNELDYTKEEMANELNVSLSTYMKWTTDSQTEPGGRNLLTILNYLNLTG